MQKSEILHLKAQFLNPILSFFFMGEPIGSFSPVQGVTWIDVFFSMDEFDGSYLPVHGDDTIY